MDVAIWITVTFGECLIVVWCVDAYRRGYRLYAASAVGVVLAIIGRFSRDAAPTVQVFLLQFFGLASAGIVLAYYLLTEAVTEPREERG